MPKGIHTVDLVPRHCAGRAMQRAGTKSTVRMPFGIPRRPAPTIGVVRISTKTLHTLFLTNS